MTELDRFYALLKEVQRMSGWVLPTAAFAPVITSLAGLSPPWPSSTGLTVCTSLAMMLSLVFVFEFLRRRQVRFVRRLMLGCAALFVACALAYFTLFSLLVYRTPVTGERFVQGFECTRDAAVLYAEHCPWLDERDLQEAGHSASLLWTAPSIALARVSLLALWFALFGSCSVLLGAFASRHSRPVRRARA